MRVGSGVANVVFAVAIVGWGGVLFAEQAPAPPEDQPSFEELTRTAERLYRQQQLEAAVQAAEQALRIAERQFTADDLRMAEALGNLGALYRLQGRDDAGQPLLDRALAIRVKHGVTGIPLGMQSEAFFDLAATGKSEASKQARAHRQQPAPQMSRTSRSVISMATTGVTRLIDGSCTASSVHVPTQAADMIPGPTLTATGALPQPTNTSSFRRPRNERADQG